MTTIDPKSMQMASLNARNGGAAAPASAPKAEPAKSGEKFSFWDLVDIINPLQHIPIVSNIYRGITGDKINNFSRIAGGAVFGGFIGAAIGGVNAIAVNETGDDLGGVAMAKMGLKKPVQKTETAANAVPKNIPVIEVRPSDTKIGDRVLARATDHEVIIWDEPVKTAQAAPPVEKTAPKKFDTLLDEQPAKEIAAAMPSPKDLNDLEPGNPEAPVPQAFAANEVPASMMKALAKYESMQRLGETANPDDTGKILSKRKFANLEESVRRY